MICYLNSNPSNNLGYSFPWSPFTSNYSITFYMGLTFLLMLLLVFSTHEKKTLRKDCTIFCMIDVYPNFLRNAFISKGIFENQFCYALWKRW